MININSDNSPEKIKSFLVNLHKEIGTFISGEHFKIDISPEVDLRVASAMLREIAEIFDNSGAILDRANNKDPFRKDPDEDDPSDFWKST